MYENRLYLFFIFRFVFEEKVKFKIVVLGDFNCCYDLVKYMYYDLLLCFIFVFLND